MPIASNTADNDRKSYIESTTVADLPVKVVGNADGSAIGSSFAGLNPSSDVVAIQPYPAYSTLITTATSTLVASFPITITGIEVQGGTLGNVAVYDNTTNSGTLKLNATPVSGAELCAGVNMAIGCYVVTTSATVLLVKWVVQ